MDVSEIFGEKVEKLSDCGITMDENERFFFVNDKDEVITYTNEKGVKAVKFVDEKKRSICIEHFLAFHSYEIGNSGETNSETSRFLYLTFNGDHEVFEAMLAPENFASKIVWKTESDFEEGSNILTMVKNISNTEKPFTGVLLDVKVLDEDSTLFIFPFKIRSYELYTEVRLPWVIQNKYNQPMVVYLSRFQKELFFNTENPEESLKVDFYPTDQGYEPMILDPERKKAMLGELSSRILRMKEEEKIETPEGQKMVTVLKFKNGDRDVLSALAGTIRYKFYEDVNIEEFSNQEYYSKLQELTDPILVLSMVPNTDKILYSGITSRI